ncbi:MAG: acyl carrier protein [Candidatus Omnitrophota bacterium]
MEIKDKIINTLTDLLKLKPQELNTNAKLYEDLGVDSTEMVEIVTALEKTFDVELSPKEITKYSTVNEIETVIKSKIM